MSVESDLQWIDRCRKAEDAWRNRARKVIDIYRDETRTQDDTVRFNILWANTETMKPALYSATPEPVVRRRYQDEDVLAKEISKVIERALEYFEDCEEFDIAAKKVRDDVLLPGRGVVKVHYVPTMAYGTAPRIQLEPTDKGYVDAEGNEYEEASSDENGFYAEGVPEEEVVDETVTFERVPWDLFVVDAQRSWDDVVKIAFGAFMDKADLKRYFGRKAAQVEMHYDATEIDQASTGHGEKKYALVWEIWDKRKREVRWVSKGYDKYLNKEKDPLGLNGFFPTPRPVYAVPANDTLVPIPLYTLYQDQARELDIITSRLYRLIDALRVRGLYAGADENFLSQLFNSDDLELIPVGNWSMLQDKGGLDNAISWLPIEQIQKTVVSLYQQRQMLIESIYQITGMADIQRGSTDPRETARAQNLKAQYSSRRLIEMQNALAVYFRDLLRIAAEIVCEKFSAETLSRITGMPVIPEMKQLMQDDAMRSYRIDIETDSTIAPDEQRDKEQAVEAITAMGQFVQMVAPLVQQGQMDTQVATEALKWFMRKFRMGRDLEDFVNAMQQQPPQPQSDPEAEAKAQKLQVETQLTQQKAQAEFQLKAAELEMKKQEQAAKLQLEREKMEFELEKERMKLELELQIMREKAMAEEQRKNWESQAKVASMKEGGGSASIKIDAGENDRKALMKMIESVTRPKKIVRDEQGNIVGVQ